MLPEPVGVLSGTVIGVVFVAAGASKLSALTEWRASATDMRVPVVVSALVPWLEVMLGALVIARIGLPWTGWAVVVVLAVFTAAIVRQLLAGYRPGCGCFGQRSVAPIGARHVVRNVVLMVVAAVAALG